MGFRLLRCGSPVMNLFEQRWQAQLEQRQTEQRLRQHKVIESAQGVNVHVEGRTCVNFASNDYLGMANSTLVKTALKNAVDTYGVGSGASHLICGHSQAHDELAAEICDWTGRESAMLFSSGYQANVAMMQTLVGKDDFVFQDRLNHASLLDGGLASGAKFRRYAHSDAEALFKLLGKTEGLGLVATDGVFSMDGDIAPLPALVDAIEQQGVQDRTLLMVDDAHGLGVLGHQGAGSVAFHQVQNGKAPVLMGTFGKAIGTAGAFVAGGKTLIDTLSQFARPYIYTTAMSPAMAAATTASIRHIRQADEQRQQLHTHIRFFQYLQPMLSEVNAQLLPSQTAIQALVLEDEQRTMRVANALWQAGFWVGAIRPPTVPAGTCRLRIALSSEHSQDDVTRLADALLGALAEG